MGSGGHPDHDTICTFRRENKALFSESFVKVLELAQELKLAQFGQITVSVDGTKLAANASKHAAVSYGRAGQNIAQLELEVQQLIAKAEQADAMPLQDGLSIPEEIVTGREPAHDLCFAEQSDTTQRRAHLRVEPLDFVPEGNHDQRFDSLHTVARVMFGSLRKQRVFVRRLANQAAP